MLKVSLCDFLRNLIHLLKTMESGIFSYSSVSEGYFSVDYS